MFPVQAFQKLVYVSNLVFGEAAGFLLPWKRVFKVTDSQVFPLFAYVNCLKCFSILYRIDHGRVKLVACIFISY